MFAVSAAPSLSNRPVNKMSRSDLLVSLVRAANSGDREMLRTTTEALAADERAKKHHLLADRLQKAINSSQVTMQKPSTARVLTQNAQHESVVQMEPRVQFADLLLPEATLDAANQLVSEQMRAEVLRAHGYEPRNRVLLSGPPGNGKTSFAEAIAESLGCPLLMVRYDALVGSLLGETNARLRALFDYVRTTPCVLFFDEFDSLGKERGDNNETGEIKRIVSFLLMQFDRLPSYVVLVAATNHAELLDRAVWRRFQFRLNFPAPSVSQIAGAIQQVFLSWPDFPRKNNPKRLAQKFEGSSFAEVIDFCQSVRRRHILGLGEVSIDEALESELRIWVNRVGPEVKDALRSNKAASPVAKPRARTTSSRSPDKSTKARVV